MGGDPDSIQALRDAVDELEAIQGEIVALSSREDGRWRHDLITLRRRLQQRIAGTPLLIDAVGFAGDDGQLLRSKLGRMRTCVAFHQASWPAVAIDREDAEYAESVRDVRMANRDFITLATILLTSVSEN